MKRSLYCGLVLLSCVLVVPRVAAAQQNALSQDPLRLATEVGRYLFAYDQAANRASTMLLSEGADAEGVEATLARQHPDGHWTVGFGRLVGDGFQLKHEVVMNDRRRVDAVDEDVDARLGAADYYTRAARAQQIVGANFEGDDGPYNMLVLPGGSETGHLTVYVVPAQTNARAYRFGGDHRFEVDPAAREIVSRTPLHEKTYEVEPLAQGAGGSAHEAVRPVETDVFFAAIRRPKAPHFVQTAQAVYRIAADGSIASVPSSTLAQRNVTLIDGR